MGYVNIENIKPGMVLANDVKNQNGIVLLGAGNEITPKHLKIFRMWGITEVDLKDAENDTIIAESMAEIDPLILQKAKEEARGIFYNADFEHPATKELFRLCTLRLVQQKLGGEKKSE